ncbi:D-alanine--poly(phosphoribitol) ligase [Streptomyces piniterrae]|uniref:D-alanine--poly(Phosphoribitol) ligase n=1 Tax=Streptomyces piniterrae TaxID=2571125 RepID=A0A4V5MMT8_9ACTN|nr:amino acid adenylation domain-containing protein [Streptomyces piniterrae]TJZ59108.1 D-alanine--poly(phosphoribitol) ligase [Streptomyces piniterrae]
MTDRTLYEWFRRTLHRSPDAVALEIQDRALTYRELDRRADAVAGGLVRAHGGAPRRVALLASRSLTAFAGYLAALRLGATVTPLNPTYPAQRNQSVCELAGVEALIVDDNGAPQLPVLGEGFTGTVLRLTDDETWALEPAGDLPPYATTPDDIAYVLFTSGSTGRPKGVPIRHRNLAPYIGHNIERFEVGPGCRISHTFDFTFDPSVFDVFVTWGAGATLVVPQRTELLKPVDYLVERGITHWFSVPSVVSVTAGLGNLPPGMATGLRYGIFIGEQLTYHQARLWRETAPNAVIENVYGPTELTVACTEFRLPRDPAAWPGTSNDTVPIGPVYDFLEHVVLDEEGRPASEGELCIRGSQRFDGYLDPADDNGRFLSYDPSSGAPAEVYQGEGGLTPAHYYRTGDRVRHENGTLVHLGRLDNQIKLRGYRIELGEIEAAVRRRPGVTDAVVVTVAGATETELVACYTGEEQRPADMMLWLRKQVPVHMVPRRFEHLAELPLNPNGKIDRPALRRTFDVRTGAA